MYEYSGIDQTICGNTCRWVLGQSIASQDTDWVVPFYPINYSSRAVDTTNRNNMIPDWNNTSIYDAKQNELTGQNLPRNA